MVLRRTRPRWSRLLTGPWVWLLLLWCAWAVRLRELDANSLTFDEAATYYVGHRSLAGILAYLQGAVREHPPGYYLLIRVWMSLAGSSEYSLRFFAVLASMLAIVLTARLGRALVWRMGARDRVQLAVYALLPALTLALFPCEVYYARDARMYTLVVAWAVLSSLLFLPLLFDQEQGKRRALRLAALLLVNGLGLFTHYYLALLIVTQFASLLLLRRWRSLFAWSAAHGLVGLLGLAWLALAAGLSASLDESWGRFAFSWPSGGQLRRLLASLLFGPIKGVPWTLVYAWGLLLALGLLVVWLRRSRTVGAWLTITTLLPVALAYLLPEPPQARYLIFVLPFAALALGQLPALAKNRAVFVWLGLSALVVAVQGFFGLPRTVYWVKSDYGRTIAAVSAHARPGDGALFYGPWQNIQFHYYQPDGFPPVAPVPEHAPPQFTLEKDAPLLQDLLNTYQRLWVIPAAVDDVDPAHLGQGWLNAHAHPVWVTHSYSLYLPPSQRAALARARRKGPGHPPLPPSEREALFKPFDLTFGERLRLERVSSDAQAIAAGEGLRLTLYWTVSEALENDVKLKMALLDERDQRWLEWESIPGRWLDPPSTWQAGEWITVRQGLVVPQGAPPGLYTIELTVIDAASGAALQPSGVNILAVDVTEPSWPPVIVNASDFNFRALGADELITLSSYELGGTRFQQGYPLPLQLHWLAAAEPTPVQDVEVYLQLWHRSRPAWLGGQASAIATKTLSLIPGYPLGDWQAGRLVSLLTALPIPADAPPGRAELTLALIAPDGQPWTIGGQQRLSLGTLTIEQRPTLRRLPQDLSAVQVDFGGLIGLRGYRLDGEARPGGQLELNYAWYALDRPPRQYAVFNHLLTVDGQFITQVDGWPQEGLVLTKQWQPGEYIPDSYTLEIPADAPPGPYLLAVGLYDAATPEKRLSATQNGQPLANDQWLLAIKDEP